MAKRGTRYVYVEGSIWRLTDRQYRRYVATNVQRYRPVSEFGTFVGDCVNVTRFNETQFAEEYERLKAEQDARASRPITADDAVRR